MRNQSTDQLVDQYMTNEPTPRELANRLDQTNRRIDQTNQRIDALSSDVATLQTSVDTSTARLESKLDTLFELLKRHVSGAHSNDQD